MSIERQHGEVIFLCDGAKCDESCETGTREFDKALETMRSEGWRAVRVSGEWFHYCAACDDKVLDGGGRA